MPLMLYTRSLVSGETDYVGYNFPLSLEIDLPTVEMTFDDSVRYTLNDSVSDDIWMVGFPRDEGYIRLGPDKRAFYYAIWHELHCLLIIQRLIRCPTDTSFGGEGHLQHCVNYLRQYFLCNADDTLEPGDFLNPDVPPGYGPFTRECRDWSALWEYNEKNDAEFVEWYQRNQSGTRNPRMKM